MSFSTLVILNGTYLKNCCQGRLHIRTFRPGQNSPVKLGFHPRASVAVPKRLRFVSVRRTHQTVCASDQVGDGEQGFYELLNQQTFGNGIVTFGNDVGWRRLIEELDAVESQVQTPQKQEATTAREALAGGVELYNQDRRSRCVEYFELALASGPCPWERRAAVFNLICTHAYLGQHEAMEVYFRDAVELGMDVRAMVDGTEGQEATPGADSDGDRNGSSEDEAAHLVTFDPTVSPQVKQRLIQLMSGSRSDDIEQREGPGPDYAVDPRGQRMEQVEEPEGEDPRDIRIRELEERVQVLEAKLATIAGIAND